MLKKGEKTRKQTASAKAVPKTKATPAKRGAKNTTARFRKATKKQVKRQLKKDVSARTPLPGSFKLIGQIFIFFKRYWRSLGKVVLVYGVLNLIFASGIISNASSALSGSSHHTLRDALDSFGLVLSGGGSSQASGLQTILLVLESLVVIWAVRHLFSKDKFATKQAYYQSTAPLIPFLITIFFIILQLLPITLGAVLVSLGVSVGAGFVEFIFALIFVLAAFWSIYMVCGSVFAMYIVTLPNMQPRAALRSAKNLVHYRRWTILRRLFFLPFFIAVFMGVIIIPLILFAHFLVVPVFFILSMLSVLFIHTYLYSLYKALLA